jgi:hypothetical protein
VNNWALLSTISLLLTQPAFAELAPCSGKDGGVSRGDLSTEQRAYVAKRFLLSCHTRNSEEGRKPLRLFTEPNLNSAVKNPPEVVYVDVFVDQLVKVEGDQFLGGTVLTPSRCPLVQFVVPDANGGGKHFDHWFMLSTDLACELIQPGQE